MRGRRIQRNYKLTHNRLYKGKINRKRSKYTR